MTEPPDELSVPTASPVPEDVSRDADSKEPPDRKPEATISPNPSPDSPTRTVSGTRLPSGVLAAGALWVILGAVLVSGVFDDVMATVPAFAKGVVAQPIRPQVLILLGGVFGLCLAAAGVRVIRGGLRDLRVITAVTAVGGILCLGVGLAVVTTSVSGALELTEVGMSTGLTLLGVGLAFLLPVAFGLANRARYLNWRKQLPPRKLWAELIVVLVVFLAVVGIGWALREPVWRPYPFASRGGTVELPAKPKDDLTPFVGRLWGQAWKMGGAIRPAYDEVFLVAHGSNTSSPLMIQAPRGMGIRPYPTMPRSGNTLLQGLQAVPGIRAVNVKDYYGREADLEFHDGRVGSARVVLGQWDVFVVAAWGGPGEASQQRRQRFLDSVSGAQ